MRKKKCDVDQELEYLRSPWFYCNEVFLDTLIGNSVGFVYIIDNVLDGKSYIGRKSFTKAKTRVSNGKKIKSRVNSEWMFYWGSSEYLKADVELLGKENFKRTILHLCASKSDLNYLETLEIFRREALLSENFYNKWASFKGMGKYITFKSNPLLV